MNKFILLIFIYNLFSSQAFGQSDIDLFSPNNRLKFADNLFCEKDYLRAADEYRLGLSAINSDTARFKMALSLQNSGRYYESADNFKSLFFHSDLVEESKLEFFRSIFLTGNFEDLRTYAQMHVYLPDQYKKEIKRLEYLSLLLEKRWISNPDDLYHYFENEDAGVLQDFYYKRRNPPRKSPLKAALLSSVIPGAGKIYAGKKGDGITAFIVTGLLTFLAYDNFNADHQTRGWIFTGLAASFYAGNIYGSAAAAQIYNAKVEFSLNSNLEFFIKENNYFLPEFDFCK